MGITFHCPNGHLVRAKEALAGKLGVCPDCGVRVRIPLEASVTEDEAELTSVQAEESKPPAATAEEAADFQNILDMDPAGSLGDPIDEAPTAHWYVRPPDGGQFGPAQGDEIRQWLREGRVPHNALVWREGWDEWKHAGETFPPTASARWSDGVVAADLRASPLATEPTAAAPEEIPVLMTTGDDHSVDPRVKRTLQRRRSERSAMLRLFALGFVSVVLFAILLLVLLR